MTATLDALWFAVEQSPDDWDRYLVLADALNDAGEERLERAVRWMVREGKRPEYVGDWCWWYCISERKAFGFTLQASLPQGMVRYGAKSFIGADAFRAAISWLADQLERVGL